MKRRLTAAALALIFPLSMAACGSQSTADACKEIATARTSVHQYSAEHSILSMPFNEVPDHLKKLLDMYRDAGKKVSNKEVKAAFNDAPRRTSTSPLISSGTTLPPPRRNTSRMRKTSTTTDRC